MAAMTMKLLIKMVMRLALACVSVSATKVHVERGGVHDDTRNENMKTMMQAMEIHLFLRCDGLEIHLHVDV